MTESEIKKFLAVLALHLNDLIDLATATYKLSITMLRAGDAGRSMFSENIPVFLDMANQINIQNQYIAKLTQDIKEKEQG